MELDLTRTIRIQHPIDSSLFNPLQFQPRALLSLTMSATWSWYNRYFVPFPMLVRDYRHSMVVVNFEVEYLAPFSFFDAPEFEVCVSSIRLRGKGSIIESFYAFKAAEKIFARIRLVCRLLKLAGDASMSATSGKIDGPLLDKFQPDEIDNSMPERPVLQWLKKIETEGQSLAKHEHEFMLYRHLCEVADQWSFIELPALVSESRESMAMSFKACDLPARQSLKKPLSKIMTKLSRPFYLFDQGRVETQAYELDDTLHFVHRLLHREGPADTPAALVIESF